MALDDQMNMFEETDDMGLMQEGGDLEVLKKEYVMMLKQMSVKVKWLFQKM